ncbi:hypothetical protein [Streptomyces sp. NPDC001068]|uniref:hypothetical protein n=1 Tax=Streptomyces sp. NPDC001068 TaxID=3364544 RepID=UPI003689A0EB
MTKRQRKAEEQAKKDVLYAKLLSSARGRESVAYRRSVERATAKIYREGDPYRTLNPILICAAVLIGTWLGLWQVAGDSAKYSENLRHVLSLTAWTAVDTAGFSAFIVPALNRQFGKPLIVGLSVWLAARGLHFLIEGSVSDANTWYIAATIVVVALRHRAPTWFELWVTRLAESDSHPLDRAGLEMLEFASVLHEERKSWPDDSRCRSWCRAHRKLRRRVSKYFSLTTRATTRDLRAEFRDQGRRLAVVLSENEVRLVAAGSVHDVQGVIDSLVDASAALLRNDRAHLLRDAPPPTPQAKRIKEIFTQRIIPGVLLIAAAFSISRAPGLADYDTHPVQLALAAAGILQIITTNKDVAGRINENFGKAVWKEPNSDSGDDS